MSKFQDDDFPEGLVEHWARLFRRPERIRRDAGSGICEAVFGDPLLFPLQRRRELNVMLNEASASEPAVVLEIGADKGGGLLHWFLLPTVCRVAGIEIRGTPYADEFTRYFGGKGTDCFFTAESSYDPTTVDKVDEWLGHDQIDVLFIDGDKSYFDLDFDRYRPLLSERAVVFFHDVRDEAPGDAYRRVCGRGYSHAEIIDTSEADEALVRAEKGLPPADCHETWLRHWRGASCGVGVIRPGRYGTTHTKGVDRK